jgi:hypothetical protein
MQQTPNNPQTSEQFDRFLVTLCKTFNSGDYICHKNLMDAGLVMFAKANEHDVKIYSGRNGYYYKMIPLTGSEPVMHPVPDSTPSHNVHPTR